MMYRANVHMWSIKLPLIKEVGFEGGINKVFDMNNLAYFYKNNDFLNLSTPYKFTTPKSKAPFYCHANYSGSVHPTLSHTKVKQQIDEYCEEIINYGPNRGNEKLKATEDELRDHAYRMTINAQQERTLLPIPFPRYLSEKFNHQGELAPQETHDFVNNVSSMSMLYSTDEVGSLVENVLLKQIKNMPYRHKVQFLKEEYIEEDDLVDIRENLQSIADAYID